VLVTAGLPGNPASQRDKAKGHRQVSRDSNHRSQVRGGIEFIAAEYEMDIENRENICGCMQKE